MPRIPGQRFEKDGFEYEVAFDFKDAAIVEDRLEVDVVGRRRPQGEGRWEEVAVTLRVDFETNHLVVLFRGEELGRISLDTALHGEYPEDDDIEALNRSFRPREPQVEAGGIPVADTIEAAIQGVPVPDPIVGCLLKSGVSAVAGQIVRCAQATQHVETLRGRVRATLHCLGWNLGSILGTAARRTFWCMVSLGFV